MDTEEAKRRHRKAPLLLLLRRAFVVSIGLVSTVTIARLVGPQAFGLAAMSLVIMSAAQIFRDFGLTSALMRKGDISPEERTFLFWFNVASTTGMAIILAVSAPFAARFYAEPVVLDIMLVSLIGFWIGGLALQHHASLSRSMHFGEIAWIDAAAVLANFAVALTLSLIRRDVWGIVWGNVAQAVVASTLFFLRSNFRPGGPERFEGMADLLKFGANATIYSLSTFVSGNIAPLLLGKTLGPEPAGHYNRAMSLFSLPNYNLVQPIAQATAPLLTHLRADPEAYRDAYLRLVRTLSTFLIPCSAVLCFAAMPLTLTLLGAAWRDAGSVLTLLAPSMAFLGLAYSINDLFITQDRSSELRTIGLAEVVFRVGSLLVGVRFGLIGVSLAHTLSTIIVALLRVLVAGRRGPVSAGEQLYQLGPGAIIAVFCGAGALAASLAPWRAPLPHYLELAMIVLGAAVGGVCSSLLPPARRAVVELLQTFGLPLGRRGKLARGLAP